MKPFNKNLTLPLAILASLPAQAVFAGQNLTNSEYAHMGYGGWFFGPLMMLLVLAAFIGAIVLILRLLGVGGTEPTRRKPLDLLNERFARGDIEKAEYEERRGALNS